VIWSISAVTFETLSGALGTVPAIIYAIEDGTPSPTSFIAVV
jgi:hypothetical protein